MSYDHLSNRYGYDDSDCEAKYSTIGEGLPAPEYFPLWGILRFVEENMGPGEDSRLMYAHELHEAGRKPVLDALRPLAKESHYWEKERSRYLAKELEIALGDD